VSRPGGPILTKKEEIRRDMAEQDKNVQDRYKEEQNRYRKQVDKTKNEKKKVA
jgi:hypothetical protein